MLNLTRPELIRSIHLEYIAAGADIIETNSFSANAISQAEYACAEKAGTMARESARIAREAADKAPRKVWVAGSIGQPLPGIAARIVDPDNGRILPTGKSGILQVRGPNRMLGYLGRPDLSAAVFRDGGWYDTGDIAHIDANGFIFLTKNCP